MHQQIPAAPRVKHPLAGLAGWVLATFAAAALGAAASQRSAGFYDTLALPDWAPPASVFGPVWTVLYAMMALAAWLLWRRWGWYRARLPLTLYLVQLLANAAWTWWFFAFREGGYAFANILLLWGMVVATIAAFWPLHRVATALLVPYLAWVTFAAFLNYSAWQMNAQVLGGA